MSLTVAHRRLTARLLPFLLPALVAGYAAAIRLDAITASYGPVTSPSWLQVLQERAHHPLQALRPSAVVWDRVPLYPHRSGPPTRYFGDPYTYQQFGRAMHGFYAAHYREPIFPFAVHVWMALLDDQDVAVSFASATFSVLAVLATYVLGRSVFSRAVGLAAAAAMAIEYDVISCGISGGRDDAFMCAVVMCAYAMLRYARGPTRGHALLLGLCGGGACLVRLTSISFLIPTFVGLFIADRRPWRGRAASMGLAVLVACLVSGPYIINCWRTFGDPLYAINVHTANSVASEGRDVDPRESAVTYLDTKLASRPFRTLDTLALGMTTYPFLNKWQGFERWVPGLGLWLSYAALMGLLLFLAEASGRWLLLIMVTSLAPFAVTWQLAPDWRFTEFAYPFLLIAAGVAIQRLVQFLAPAQIRRWFSPNRPWPSRRALVIWVPALAGLSAIAAVFWWGLPVLILKEALAANEDVSVTAGARDAAFFRTGWSPVVTNANVILRISAGSSPTIVIPLPRVDDYSMSIRLDPFPRPIEGVPYPLPVVRLFMNGQLLRRIELTWNPQRVGAYDVPLPRHLLRAGFNRLLLMVERREAPDAPPSGPSRPAPRPGTAVGVWYVRVHPPVPVAR